MRLPLLLFALFLALGCMSTPPAPSSQPSSTPATQSLPPNTPPVIDAGLAKIALKSVVENLQQPVGILPANDGTSRYFIVEQRGTVRILKDGALLEAPFLDVSGDITSDGEQGLLSIALDPAFKTNGRVIVSVTDQNGDTLLSRYTVSASDANKLDPASPVTVLTQKQPYPNHNGGLALFGPDGNLWFGLGDGGNGGDPEHHGQDKQTWLGKLLRIHLNEDGTYGVPKDNPFAKGGGKPEIWAYGLRNPWRFSFDRATKDLWIADVGQDTVEEVDREAAGDAGGHNYGWNLWEGNQPYTDGASAEGLTMPVATYTHAQGGCSITGGYVYRGTAIPALVGTYLYADYCSGKVWGLTKDGNDWTSRVLLKVDGHPSAFGEDADGELFLVDHGGTIDRIVAG